MATERRARPLLRAIVLALGLSSLGAAFAGCIIEERPFDPQLADCNDYCDEIEAKCTDPYKVYDRRDTCLAVCRLMDSGQGLGGSEGNTLRCRLERLRAPDFEAATSCPRVGPGGDGECGSDCEALCTLRQQVCAEVQPAQFEIRNPELCEQSCAGLRDEPTFDASRVAASPGDSMQCRLVHISEAAVSRSLAEVHCVHTQVVPLLGETVPCSDPQDLPRDVECSTYCGLVMAACQGENQMYESAEQCLATCQVLDQGMKGDQAGNSLRCRRYHAYSALGNPREHCLHAGPTGDTHCGSDNCYATCQILKRACPTRFAADYAPGADPADLGSCEASCLSLEGSGTDGFRSEPRYVVPYPNESSLKCRAFHAVRALEAPDDAAECASAFGEAGSSCG